MADTYVESSSDGDFEVTEVGPVGPAAAASKVASFMIGEPPSRRPGDLSPDPVALEKAVLSKGRPKAKLFKMSDPALAQEYADLEHRMKTSGEVAFQKVKEIVGDSDYALFVCWIEYEKPVEEIREQTEGVMKEKKAALLRSLQDQRDEMEGKKPEKIDDVQCTATTAKKTRCRSKRKPGMDVCGRHVPPEPVAVAMDAPPVTHRPLGVPS